MGIGSQDNLNLYLRENIMKKTKQMLTLLLAGSLLLAGCGKKEVPDAPKQSVSDTSSTIENNSENSSEPTDANQTDNGDKPSNDVSQSPETPSPTAGVITPKQGYSDSDREVSIVGLKEYKQIKTDKYTDKAKKGKKFLVLFLKVRNRTNEKVYFNVNYLSAKVDGKDILNTVLFNDPEGYPTSFSNIAANSYYGGFIVWEVPKNWKKIKISYEGWRDSDGLTLNSTLTRKDLKKTEKYSPALYEQGDK